MPVESQEVAVRWNNNVSAQVGGIGLGRVHLRVGRLDGPCGHVLSRACAGTWKPSVSPCRVMATGVVASIYLDNF